MKKIKLITSLLVAFIVYFIPNSLILHGEIDPRDTSKEHVFLWHSYRDSADFTPMRKIFRRGLTYKITFIGTYHIWPEFRSDYGIDALFFQDIPIYRSNNHLRDSISQNYVDNLFSKKIPLNSNSKLTIPNPYSTETDSLSFVPLKDQGIRINGKTLDSYDLVFSDTNKHVYQIVVKGDDRNYLFEFLNNIYSNGSLNQAYQNLSGNLYLFIRSLSSSDTCQTLIKNKGKSVELQIDFAELFNDTTFLKGVRNLLKTRSEEEQRRSFVVRSERKFYCIDSIECKVQNQNKNLLILIDRSNTMDQVVGSGNKKKIEIEKQVVTKFIQNALNREDSVALIFFNTEYELIPWTNDKSLIIDKVSKLEPKGNTLLYKYILKSLEYLSSFPKKNKALVVFTDGINQPPYFDSSSTFENIISKIGQYYGISIYFVVIPSNPSPDRNRALQRLWEIKSTHTNSIIYTPNDILELERDVSKIVEDYSYNLCCSIVLEIPNPCLGKTASEVVFVDLLYSPIEKDTILLFRIPIRCSKVFLESMQNCLIIKEFDKSLQSEENYYFIEYGFLNFGYSPITINGISSKINNLSISEELPFQIPPHEIKRLKFSFPFSTNHILDTLKIFKNSSCGDSIIIFDFFINDEETSSGIFENNSTKHKRFDNLFVNLFPNPASKVEEVNVNINVSEGKVVTFDIYDFKGELLDSKEFIPNYSGIHAIKLNTKGFTNGIYFLLIKYEGNFELKPFLIKD